MKELKSNPPNLKPKTPEGIESPITFVDENDNVIGMGSKKEAWEKGISHRIVRIFLFNSKGELLITKRADNLSSLSGRWDQSAAGHVDVGEDYITAANRELEEEVGVGNIKLTQKGKFFHIDKDEEDKIKKRFTMLYTGIFDGEIKLDSKDVSEIRWIDVNILKNWMNEQPNDFTEGFIENFKNLQKIDS